MKEWKKFNKLRKNQFYNPKGYLIQKIFYVTTIPLILMKEDLA